MCGWQRVAIVTLWLVQGLCDPIQDGDASPNLLNISSTKRAHSNLYNFDFLFSKKNWWTKKHPTHHFCQKTDPFLFRDSNAGFGTSFWWVILPRTLGWTKRSRGALHFLVALAASDVDKSRGSVESKVRVQAQPKENQLEGLIEMRFKGIWWYQLQIFWGKMSWIEFLVDIPNLRHDLLVHDR